MKKFFASDGSLIPNAGDPPFDKASPATVLTEALIVASRHHRNDVIAYLLDRGAPVNGRTTSAPNHATALHDAALNGFADTVKLLLNRGADPTLTDDQFKSTPAGWAKHHNHAEVANVLETAMGKSPP